MGIKLGVSLTQNSQSIANNKSNVTVNVILTFDSGSWSGNGSQGYLTIDGTKYGFWGTFNTGRATSGTETMFSKTVDIPHDSEGKKTLAVSAEYKTDTWGTKTASASQVLTDIPRASAIAATDANIGSVSMISVLRKSDVYTHSIAYQFGSLSGYIAADGSASSSEVKHTGTSVPFKLPDSFYAQIPNAKTGTCTLTVRTYSGSTQIGSTETTSFTVTAAEGLCKPTVSGTVTDSNSTTKNLTGNAAKLVRYKSTAHCTISAAANKSATLKETRIGGTVVSGTTHDIAGVEESAVEFAATDSRGYTSTAQVEFEIVPYVLLTSNPSGRRTDPTSGKATLSLRGNYYNGSFGSQNNSLTLRYRYGVQGGSFGRWKTVSPSISGSTYSADISLTGLDYETTYAAEVEVKDKLDTITKTAVIRRGIPIFDWGENDVAFHVPVTINGAPVVFKKNVSVTGAGTMAVGSTFKLNENIIGKHPIFATLAYSSAVGRAAGNVGNRTVTFYSLANSTSGVYVYLAVFSITDDGLTMTLSSTKRILLKSDGVTVESNVSLQFGEVILISG